MSAILSRPPYVKFQKEMAAILQSIFLNVSSWMYFAPNGIVAV